LTPATGNVAGVEANVATGQGAGPAGQQPADEPSNPAPATEAGTAGAGGADGGGTAGGADGGGTPTGAGLAPLPYDGVGSVAVGTVLWLVALLVMIPLVGPLRHAGHLWWLATAACGFCLGLLGLFIVIRRRNRIRRGEQSRTN
jgi:Protein of unknown function (DUF2530)